MPAPLKYKRICIGIIALTVLLAIIHAAIQRHNPVDFPTDIFDETVATANGFKVRLVHPDSPEKGLIFFLAGKADANTAKDYARQFAQLSYYVVVLDVEKLLTFNSSGDSSGCINIAQNLQDIQKSLSNKLDFDQHLLPILVGNGEGAALVYGALAQAKERSFHAAISINFTEQLHNVPDLCSSGDFIHANANGTSSLAPVEHLSSTWYVFQGEKTAGALAIHRFTERIANAKLTIQSESGAPPISDVIQVLGWLDPRLSDQLASDDREGDLPINEVISVFDNPSQTMAIIVTGDGGWAEIDKSIANTLAQRGIPTVALDSLSYFWKRRTPQETAIAIEKIMAEYLAKWHKRKVILIGYSFGADVLPFIANRISIENREYVALIVLLGIGDTATFEFHLSSWMDADTDDNRLAVLPEVQKMSWAKSICIYGTSDKDANCTSLDVPSVKVIRMSGDHHFDKKYEALVQHILENISGQE